MSHGRGGAGNMGSVPDEINRDDMKTPTLKSDHYTTGRGGKQLLSAYIVRAVIMY